MRDTAYKALADVPLEGSSDIPSKMFINSCLCADIFATHAEMEPLMASLTDGAFWNMVSWISPSTNPTTLSDIAQMMRHEWDKRLPTAPWCTAPDPTSDRILHARLMSLVLSSASPVSRINDILHPASGPSMPPVPFGGSWLTAALELWGDVVKKSPSDWSALDPLWDMLQAMPTSERHVPFVCERWSRLPDTLPMLLARISILPTPVYMPVVFETMVSDVLFANTPNPQDLTTVLSLCPPSDRTRVCLGALRDVASLDFTTHNLDLIPIICAHMTDKNECALVMCDEEDAPDEILQRLTLPDALGPGLMCCAMLAHHPNGCSEDAPEVDTDVRMNTWVPTLLPDCSPQDLAAIHTQIMSWMAQEQDTPLSKNLYRANLLSCAPALEAVFATLNPIQQDQWGQNTSLGQALPCVQHHVLAGVAHTAQAPTRPRML